MKKSFIIYSIVFVSLIGMAWQFATYAVHNSTGPIAGVANDPASNFANCSSCHSGSVVTPVTNWITSNIPLSGYTPGVTYTITATATNPNLTKFGFEIGVQNTSGVDNGTLIASNNGVQLIANTKNTYITHSSTSTLGTGSKTWTFEWTAPTKGNGDVTFYGSFLGANDNKNNLGDLVYITSYTVKEATQTTSTKSFVETLKVNVYPNPTADIVSLNYSLNKPSEVEIKLLNQVGTEVMILQDKKIVDGAQQTTFDLKSTLPSGTYFIALYVDGAIKTEKLIIK